MYDVDISCQKCDHAEVCSLKSDFESAQKAVDDLSVTLTNSSGRVSSKYLRNFDWIEPVKLRCKHFANRSQAITATVEKAEEILTKAKVNYVSELVGKPVEVTLENDCFKDFRILTEVL